MMAEASLPEAGIGFATAGAVSYGLMTMTLEEIKQAIEKLPREEFFELARRLSARYPELWQEQVARVAESGRFDPV
jgi:hypothetical protein